MKLTIYLKNFIYKVYPTYVLEAMTEITIV